VQNFNTIMKQAKKMQERMATLQKELETKTVEAQAGGRYGSCCGKRQI